MLDWFRKWLGRKRGRKATDPVAAQPVQPIEKEKNRDPVAQPDPVRAAAHAALHALYVRHPQDKLIARRHLQEIGWCYGERGFNEALKDETIAVSVRLLELFYQTMDKQMEKAVRSWLAAGGRCLLFCTQRRDMPLYVHGQGIRGSLNRELVQLVEPAEASGRAIQVSLPAGFTSAYRRNFLLLLPKAPVESQSPPDAPQMPDARDADVGEDEPEDKD